MTDRRQSAPVMVPLLVTFTGSVEVMVPEPAQENYGAIATAMAYVTPQGFTIERIEDWEALPR